VRRDARALAPPTYHPAPPDARAVAIPTYDRPRHGERARGRPSRPAVLADLFAWRSDRTFDAVVFCFWLSHVPLERFDRFVATVAEALPARGRLFFLDGRRESTSTAADHSLPTAAEQVMTRRLNDGSTYSVVKNFWSSDDLERTFATAGVELTVRETPTYFQYGVGERR
jgi:hypothetical protein